MSSVTMWIPVAPERCRINAAYRARAVRVTSRAWRAQMYLTADYRRAKADIAMECAQRRNLVVLRGPLELWVTEVWRRTHRRCEAVGLAFGDVDAPLKCLQDGLADGGLFEDDAQIENLHARKRVDKNMPGFWIRVEERKK